MCPCLRGGTRNAVDPTRVAWWAAQRTLSNPDTCRPTCAPRTTSASQCCAAACGSAGVSAATASKRLEPFLAAEGVRLPHACSWRSSDPPIHHLRKSALALCCQRHGLHVMHLARSSLRCTLQRQELCSQPQHATRGGPQALSAPRQCGCESQAAK